MAGKSREGIKLATNYKNNVLYKMKKWEEEKSILISNGKGLVLKSKVHDTLALL